MFLFFLRAHREWWSVIKMKQKVDAGSVRKKDAYFITIATF